MNGNMKKEYLKPLVSVVMTENLLDTELPVTSVDADENCLMGKFHGDACDAYNDDFWNNYEPKSIWDD